MRAAKTGAGGISRASIALTIAAIACWSFAVAIDVSFPDMFEWALISGLVVGAAVLALLAAAITAGSTVRDSTLLTEVE